MKTIADRDHGERRAARRNTILVMACLAIVAAWGIAGHHRVRAESRTATPSSIGIPVTFKDIARAAGIDFKQDSTMTEQKYYLETMGTGAGFIDYNQDGLYDIYLVQTAATDAYKPPRPLHSLSLIHI